MIFYSNVVNVRNISLSPIVFLINTLLEGGSCLYKLVVGILIYNFEDTVYLINIKYCQMANIVIGQTGVDLQNSKYALDKIIQNIKVKQKIYITN